MINQTEALVAIDVNSGKATRERNIEETALKTNLEAADEVGRQLKLRDLSGLIVIDFIDMEENRNKSAIERKLKDALRHDRARIQVGSISHFGLLEMSRQRLRPSLAESVSQSCPHCAGSGRIRSTNSSALQILRVVEEEAGVNPGQDVTIHVHPDVALYILNQKRASLASLEARLGIIILIEADATLIPPDFRLGGDSAEPTSLRNSGGRNKQGRNNKNARNQNDKSGNKPIQSEAETEHPEDDEEQPKRKRRGRRGGRRRKRRGNEDGLDIPAQDNAVASIAQEPQIETADAVAKIEANDAETHQAKKKSLKRAKPKAVKTTEAEAGTLNSGTAANDQAEDNKKPAAKKKTKAKNKDSSNETKKAKTKTKKTAAKVKTKAAKSKVQASAKMATGAENFTKSEQIGSDQNAAANEQERSPKSSVKMTVIDIDATPAAKAKKKGWWSR